MKKVLLTLLASVVCALAAFALVFSLLETNRIEHCRQVLIPMEGRICAYANGETQLPFYFLDEKELSELSQKENIQSVLLACPDGTVMKAKDWEVSAGGSVYTGSKYASKELSVTIMPDESVEFSELILQYPDKEERFSLGRLRVDIIPGNEYEPCLQIWSMISGMGDNPFVSESEELIDYKDELSYGAFTFSPGRETKILGIDLGIPDLAVNPGSLKQIPSDFDFGAGMADDPTYQDYLKIQRIPEMWPAALALDIQGNVTYLSRLMTSEKSLSGLEIFIISPRFRCIDVDSGNEFIYANTNFTTVGIQIISDRLAADLLEKEGR